MQMTCKNKTNHLMSSNSHPSPTINQAKLCLKWRGRGVTKEVLWLFYFGGILRELVTINTLSVTLNWENLALHLRQTIHVNTFHQEMHKMPILPIHYKDVCKTHMPHPQHVRIGLTFGLLTWLSVGIIYLSMDYLPCTYQVWSFWGKAFLSYLLHKVWETDIPTELPTNMRKVICPSFERGGGL